MASTTISHFVCGDNGHKLIAVVQPESFHVLLSLKLGSFSPLGAMLTPKQARRVADALRVAAREAEERSKPRPRSSIEAAHDAEVQPE